MPLLSWLKHPHAFAIDISDDAICLLESKGGFYTSVVSFSREALEPGIINDGEILDQARLAEAIQKAVQAAKPAPPKTKSVIAMLPESRTLICRLLIAPDVVSHDFPDAVLARAEETFPVNLNEYAWDYLILSQSEEGYAVVFAAAPRELVQAYEQTFSLAGLTLEALGSESMALMRALVPKLSGLATDESVMIMDMGRRSTALALVDHDGLQLSVTIPQAGDAVTESIAKKNKLKLDEAEKRKRRKGLKEEATAKPIVSALKPLIEEIHEAKAFFQERQQKKISKMFLAGGSSSMPGLSEHLSEAIGLSVEKPVPLYELAGVDPGRVAMVAGLAMRAAKISPGLNFILQG